MGFRQQVLRAVRRVAGTQMIADMIRDSRRPSPHADPDPGTYQQLWRSAAAEVIDLRRRVAELERDREHLSGVYRRLDRQEGLAREAADHLRDVVRAQIGETVRAMQPMRVVAHRQVADASPDHLHPRGTAHDNTRSLRFVLACERLFGGRLTLLDLGCAGGGLVLDFVLRGHPAVGIEGSDYSLKHRRGEWAVIPDRLFTADLTVPFTVEDTEGAPAAFTIITAWELLEHIAESDLEALLSNVSRHLAHDGVFVGSVAMYEDTVDGVKWHQTVCSREWWLQKFANHGFEMIEPSPFTDTEFCRGSGNGIDDVDFAINPDLGFHFILRYKRLL